MNAGAYLENMRISHWWWWVGICAIGAYVSDHGVGAGSLLPVLLGFSFLFASVHSLNNTHDHDSDRGNPSKRNPVADGRMSFAESRAESAALGAAGLVCLGAASLEGLAGGIALSVLSVAYQVPPFRTKGRPFLDIGTITLLYSMPFLIGYVSAGPADLEGAALALLFGLLSGTVHPLQTAKDIEEDRRNGDVTVSVRIGAKGSVLLSLALMASTLLYLEALVLAGLLDPGASPVPLAALPALPYYLRALKEPSGRRIGGTWRVLRLCACAGILLAFYPVALLA